MRFSSLSRRLFYSIIVCLMVCSACTSTPTPAAEPTPIPVLALPEHLPLEGQTVLPEQWPDLPADLFFLRDGQLWRWPAGAEPELLVKVSNGTVVDYRVTPDGLTVAYATAAGQLGTVNRRTGDQVRVSLPNRRAYIGFALAPDGAALAVSDAEGLYKVTLPSGATTQLLGIPADEFGGATWLPQSWSPDGRWLLANLAAADNFPLYLIDTTSQRFRLLLEGCQGEVPWAAWREDDLWLSSSDCGAGGELVLLEISAGSEWNELRRSPEAVANQLVPYAWTVLPGDRLAFANYDAGDAVASGLYFLEAGGTLVPLITASCVAAADASCIPVEWGLVAWAADASAFALTGPDGAIVIGALQSGALWDMRTLLKTATNLQWGLP